ncbi:MAG: biopolymer transporter ExbD [Phycisphaerae bacterium]|nr:biopolymer transporter ExbD [Phycisphaerae bacterium]MBN8599393.1 biopolymer transporter ExbD [Planctomycetota bacterium]
MSISTRAHIFRRRNALAVHEEHYAPNMTPMVDVVMVILVFFMASASVLGPEWLLKTALPPSKPTVVKVPEQMLRIELLLTTKGSKDVVITTRSASAIPTLVDAPIEHIDNWLTEVTKDRSPKELAIVVRPRENVPYEAVIQMHEHCARIGIEKIGILDPTK